MRKKLTLWQRAILGIMYSVEQERLKGDDTAVNHTAVQFERKAFEYLLDFDWQGCHTTKINELEKMGWITVRLYRGRVAAYALTSTATTYLWENYTYGMAHVAGLTEDQKTIPF